MINDGIGVEQTGENEMNGIDMKFLKVLSALQFSRPIGLLLMTAIFSLIKGENHKMSQNGRFKKNG